MPGNDQSKGRPDHPGDQDQSNVSRRKLLGAAGVGAAGLAAGAFGGLTAAHAATAGKPAAGKPGADEPSLADGQAKTDEHVVVHVHAGADADIDVFRGTGQTTLHDPDLAARLRRAAP
ncbi:MAG TPA: hypothetical protein VHY58_11565 [Streptosporangiaceae bacterium]|jgi:hypothetical protein|nr:hypothetical protein [Streptosporangiaceae bacterium]